MAGNIDKRDGPPLEIGPGKPQLNGQSALFLIFQPIRIHPRQRVHKGGFAVIHVARGGNHNPHHGCPSNTVRTASIRCSSWSGATANRSISRSPPLTRPITAGVPVRSGWAKPAGNTKATDSNSTPGAPPPPTAPTLA